MIRINLLPREEKSSSDVSFAMPNVADLVLPVAMFAIALIAVGGTAIAQKMKVDALAKSVAAVDEQSRAIAPQIARVNQLALERAELDLRLGIIDKLQHGRTRTVRVMDEIARCVPDHLWFGSAQEEEGGLTIEGSTFSMLVVSEFISRLERSSLFADVEMESAEKSKLEDQDVVEFRIKCRITPDANAD